MRISVASIPFSRYVPIRSQHQGNSKPEMSSLGDGFLAGKHVEFCVRESQIPVRTSFETKKISSLGTVYLTSEQIENSSECIRYYRQKTCYREERGLPLRFCLLMCNLSAVNPSRKSASALGITVEGERYH